MKATAKSAKLEETVGVRIPSWVRNIYESRAAIEERKLSEILRRVLVKGATSANGAKSGR